MPLALTPPRTRNKEKLQKKQRVNRLGSPKRRRLITTPRSLTLSKTRALQARLKRCTFQRCRKVNGQINRQSRKPKLFEVLFELAQRKVGSMTQTSGSQNWSVLVKRVGGIGAAKEMRLRL